MSSFAFWDWLAYSCIVVAAIAMAADTAISQSESIKKHVPRPLKGGFSYLPLVVLLIGLGAFWKVSTREPNLDLPNGTARAGSPFSLIQAWGVNNEVYFTVVKPDADLVGHHLRRLALIARTNFASVDKMTDVHISKSQPYTILDGFTTLATSDAGNIMINPDRTNQIEFNVIELPSMVPIEQVSSLGDVEKFGGRILATTSASMVFNAAPRSKTVQNGCLPNSSGTSSQQ